METWQRRAQKVALDRKAHASDRLTIATPWEVRVANFEVEGSIQR
jgi:hypothetical protein